MSRAATAISAIAAFWRREDSCSGVFSTLSVFAAAGLARGLFELLFSSWRLLTLPQSFSQPLRPSLEIQTVLSDLFNYAGDYNDNAQSEAIVAENLKLIYLDEPFERLYRRKADDGSGDDAYDYG